MGRLTDPEPSKPDRRLDVPLMSCSLSRCWLLLQVVAGVHNPWVSTDTSFKEFEQMR